MRWAPLLMLAGCSEVASGGLSGLPAAPSPGAGPGQGLAELVAPASVRVQERQRATGVCPEVRGLDPAPPVRISEALDGPRMRINAQGCVVFAETPDFEAPADEDADNAYVIRLLAGDLARPLRIQVIDVDETPRDFSLPAEILAPEFGFSQLAALDADADGDLDLLGATLAREVLLLEGLGNSRLLPARALSAWGGVARILSDGDGLVGVDPTEGRIVFSAGDLEAPIERTSSCATSGDAYLGRRAAAARVVFTRRGDDICIAELSAEGRDALLPVGNVRQWTAADLNGDGLTDLVVTRTTEDAFIAQVLLALDDGAFAPRLERPFAPGVPFQTRLVPYQRDADAGHELVVSTDPIRILDWSPREASGLRLVPAGEAGIDGEGLRVADADGDGRDDLLSVDGTSLLIARSDGGGTTRVEIGARSGEVVAADLDADGAPELFGLGGADGIVVLRGVRTGAWLTVTEPEQVPFAFDLLVADVNGDRIDDIVVPNLDSFTIALGSRSGDFRISDVVIDNAAFAAAARANEDARTDLYVSDAFGGGLRLLTSGASGAFEVARSWASPYDLLEIQTADLDRDGLDDFVARHASGLVSGLARGPETLTEIPITVGELRLADVTGDGLPDIVGSDATDGSNVALRFARGLGTGAFATVELVPTTLFQDFDAGDLDGDGRAEVVVGRANGVSVYRPSDTFTLGQPERTELPFTVRRIRLADFDRDGRLDVIAVSPRDDALILLLGAGDGTFLPPRVHQTSGRIGPFLASGDINGDEFPDALLVSDRRVRVYRGFRSAPADGQE